MRSVDLVSSDLELSQDAVNDRLRDWPSPVVDGDPPGAR